MKGYRIFVAGMLLMILAFSMGSFSILYRQRGDLALIVQEIEDSHEEEQRRPDNCAGYLLKIAVEESETIGVPTGREWDTLTYKGGDLFTLETNYLESDGDLDVRYYEGFLLIGGTYRSGDYNIHRYENLDGQFYGCVELEDYGLWRITQD
jgi:hypothetical protein